MHVRWLWVLSGLLMLVIVPPLMAQAAPSLQVVWSPNNDQIALFDQQKLVIYDASFTPQQEMTFFNADESDPYVPSLSWSPLADKIAVVFYSSKLDRELVQLWDVATGEPLSEVVLLPWSVQVEWLPDNEHIAILEQGKDLSVYAADGTLADRWTLTYKNPYDNPDTSDDDELTLENIVDFAWSPDTLMIISIKDGPPLTFWDRETKEWIKEEWCCFVLNARIELNQSMKKALTFSYETTSLEVRTLATPGDSIEYDLPPSDKVNLMMLAGWRDQNYVWSISTSGILHVWRPQTDRPVGSFPIDIEHFQAISPDGTKIVYADEDAVRIEEVESGVVLARVDLGDDTPFSGAWLNPLFPDPAAEMRG